MSDTHTDWFFNQEETLDIKMERAKQDKLRYMMKNINFFIKLKLCKFLKRKQKMLVLVLLLS